MKITIFRDSFQLHRQFLSIGRNDAWHIFELDNMIKYRGLSTLEVLIEAGNYNKWIADEIISHISPPVLEVGAGNGNLTGHCLKIKPLYVTDKDSGLIHHLKKKFSKEENVFIKTLDIAKNKNNELLCFFSSVFAINVLEHIRYDVKSLKNINKLLKKNGKLILLVPAKKFAYTRLDRELGHFRRYEKEEIIQKLQNSGYAVEKIYFFNIVGHFSWYVRDKFNRTNIKLRPYHIKIFDAIVPLLRFIESIIAPPVGISLIVVAKKL